MVYGAIRYDIKIPLLRIASKENAVSYCQTLQNGLFPFVDPVNYIIQQDGARCHTAKYT